MSKSKALLPGIGYMLLGGLLMSIQGLGVRLLKEDVTVEFIVFIRFLICFLISLFVSFVVRGEAGTARPKNWSLLLIRSLVAYFALMIVFVAIKYYNSGLVFAFFFSTPLFLPLIARLWLGVPILHRLWAGLGIALLGIVCVVNPFGEEVQPGLLFVLIAAILGGVSVIGVRVLHRTDSTRVITFSYFAVGLFGSIVTLLFTSTPYLTSYNVVVLSVLIGVGITGYLFQLFVTQALKYGPSRVLSPFSYSSSIFSLVIDASFFALIPSKISVIGVVLVIIGTVINVVMFPSDHIQRIGK